MGKKGGSTTYQERPLSPQELRLLESQKKALDAQMEVAKGQEARSNFDYENWKRAHLPMETGMLDRGASRENGYQGGVKSDGRLEHFHKGLAAQIPEEWGNEIQTAPPIDYNAILGNYDGVAHRLADIVAGGPKPEPAPEPGPPGDAKGVPPGARLDGPWGVGIKNPEIVGGVNEYYAGRNHD